MMEDEFDILAAKVLAEEASNEEQLRFARLLAAQPLHAQEFAGMQAAWETLRSNGHLSQALHSSSPEIPADRLRGLQQVVRQNKVAVRKPVDVLASDEAAGWLPQLCFWLRRAGLHPATLSVVLLALALGGFFVFQNMPLGGTNAAIAFIGTAQGKCEVLRDGRSLPVVPGFGLGPRDFIVLESGSEVTLVQSQGLLHLGGSPQKVRVGDRLGTHGEASRSSSNSNLLHRILFSPARQIPLLGVVSRTRGAHDIHLYSPAGATADLTPLLLWNTVAGKRYDVVLTDEFDVTQPALRLSSVEPPIVFENAWKERSLKPDGLYRLRISETGNFLTSSEFTFRTLKQAAPNEVGQSGPEALIEAFRLLDGSPSRVGDALAILMTLPADVADSELALRLKLAAFATLGFQSEFDEAADRLAVTSSK